MTLTLTNSLGGTKQPFIPRNPQEVRMYVCGPTVYDYAHIGNARPAVVFDVLVRVLERHFGRVIYARNLTDVDDKINAAAAAAGVPISTITERFTAAYHADLAALGVRSPTIEPKVTDHRPQIIGLIQRLIAADHAYSLEGHVLYHVPSFPSYGLLSRRKRGDMIAGARVEVAPFKRDPADFVLWKPSDPSQPGWDSPWGRGRPGWHIECSAMIEHHLGNPIDIHGGGMDLQFPHHENEIAQGTRARFWIHNGFVTVEGRKMSKSLGNVVLMRELLAEAPGEAVRLALLSAPYRQPLDWTAQTLPQAVRSLSRLYAAVGEGPKTMRLTRDSPLLVPFRAALDDDLNTPAALAELFALAEAARTSDADRRPRYVAALVEAGAELGLLQKTEAAWQAGLEPRAGTENEDRIRALQDARAAARDRRDFLAADDIRDQLLELGVSVEDQPLRRLSG
ncbi:cysteine--tRNA ligase [Paracoccus benzoatiresistens]|uniref:Cysteine--tRNA ligase n=1 Tax=Paracoccus benzoatiresistens TaxID=2997341 RepID=A0ABT4J5P7_9RHOB|nr:cysteine--tRNA ligase [Paracoccus sp. EF6]MCZ0962451.1 cysteine--tRNA ligase [Paracoccus sp. EF6]